MRPLPNLIEGITFPFCFDSGSTCAGDGSGLGLGLATGDLGTKPVVGFLGGAGT